MISIKVFDLELPLKTPFTIAHGSYSFRNNVFIEIQKDDHTGYGEGPIVPYYKGSVQQVKADLIRNISRLRAKDIEQLLEDPLQSKYPLFEYPVSSCAFQEAILDLASKIRDVSLSSLLKISSWQHSFRTTFTIAFNEDIDEMVRGAVNSGFSSLKIKCGIPGDVERVKRIREALPEALLFIDANQGWTYDEACTAVREFENIGVELIEEPLSSGSEDIARLSAMTSIPIVLDESVTGIRQLEQYLEKVPHLGGVVVKNAKCGGPLYSKALIDRAREAHLKVFLSSMVESSAGLYSAVTLAPLASYIDLDAPLLLARSYFNGVVYENQSVALHPQGIEADKDLIKDLQSERPLLMKE